MGFYSAVGSITPFMLFLFILDVESMRTLKNVAAKHGGSITIPCLYEERYKINHKYWCKGSYWSSCSVVAYANTSGSTSVTDYPEQNMFTVEMNPVSDSGYYWCAAEIVSSPDDGVYLYLTVSEDPGLSVVKSRVSGAEGGSVTVQCLYSAAYRDKQKQWCRFKDRSCNTVGKTDTSQNSAVHISDNRHNFSVEIRGLKKSDAGWYWCSAGDLQVPVHVSVTDPPPVLPAVTEASTTTVTETSTTIMIITTVTATGTITTRYVSTDPWNESLINWFLVALLLLLMILGVIITCALIKKCKTKNLIRTREKNNDATVHTESPNHIYDEIIYSSVVYH